MIFFFLDLSKMSIYYIILEYAISKLYSIQIAHNYSQCQNITRVNCAQLISARCRRATIVQQVYYAVAAEKIHTENGKRSGYRGERQSQPADLQVVVGGFPLQDRQSDRQREFRRGAARQRHTKQRGCRHKNGI